MSHIFENAHIVTPTHDFHGYLVVMGGKIHEFGEGKAPERGEDCRGDLLIPGLIELHTDHLEVHFMPRPKVEWPALSAVLAHDAQVAGAGITTVLDALRVGNDYDAEKFGARMKLLAEAIEEAKANNMTRAEHFIHLRCELACEDVVEEMEPLVGDDNIRLVSLMDHTPGQRQFSDIAMWKKYYGGKKGASDAEMDAIATARLAIHEQYAAKNRIAVLERCRRAGLAVASHDDTTLAHVEEAVADGLAISEFPTTLAAAEKAHGHGMKVLMGGPNVVRGGSHSGNVSARKLAEAGLLDLLSSDYVPASLLMAALRLADVPALGGLAGAIRLVTKNPADAIGLNDRGVIERGKRADLIRVQQHERQPVVRGVWRDGRRVA